LCLCDARLRAPGFGVRLARFVPPAGEGPAARRGAADLPGRLARGLRGRDRAPGRTGRGDPGPLSDRAVLAGPAAFRPAGDLRPGGRTSQCAAPGLQPARVRLSLRHGLFPPCDSGLRPSAQSPESPGLEPAGLVEARPPALGSLPGTVVLCPDPA